METLTIEFENKERLFYYRKASPADKGVIRQIFDHNAYDLTVFPLSPQLNRYYLSCLDRGVSPIIMDAGANIGAATVWFGTVYPQARIIAIEPEKGNLDVLRRNIQQLQVTVIEGGISSTDGEMVLSDPGSGEWGYRVSAAAEGSPVKVFAAQDIIKQQVAAGGAPFICKIDIEGGEHYLFDRCTDWIEEFAAVVIELHDWMLPGQANSRNFLNAVAKGYFDLIFRGENIYLFNTQLLKNY